MGGNAMPIGGDRESLPRVNTALVTSIWLGVALMLNKMAETVQHSPTRDDFARGRTMFSLKLPIASALDMR